MLFLVQSMHTFMSRTKLQQKVLVLYCNNTVKTSKQEHFQSNQAGVKVGAPFQVSSFGTFKDKNMRKAIDLVRWVAHRNIFFVLLFTGLSRYDCEISFHRFTKNPVLPAQWLHKTQRKGMLLLHTQRCGAQQESR